MFAFKKGKFVVRATDIEPKNVSRLYDKWLQNQAPKVLERQVRDYCRIIGLDPSMLKIRIKSQRNRVGSLGRNLTIYFNKNILRLPLKIIEYVVVHELCHIHIPSHSKKYWQLVAKIMVDYKKRKEWLEKNCFILS